jgi:ferredoxin
MDNMRVSINRETCIGCGLCEATCPEVFKLIEDGKSSIVEKHRKNEPGEGEVANDLVDCVENAKASCPVEAISAE